MNIAPASSAAETSPSTSTARHDASALRDATFDAHRRVPHGEGDKLKHDLTPDSLPARLRSLAAWRDASRMFVVPERGQPTLRVVEFEYHSDKPMQGWLDSAPPGGKLRVRAAICVSWHNNLPGEQYATTNSYAFRVTAPDGRVTQVPHFGPAISKTKEYASASALLEIDVSKPGDYVFECYPLATGVTGWVEGRRLVLHVTGKEPVTAP